MRKKYGWYFPKSDTDIKALWDEAILTLDANVLLDLYRYHEDTRNALLRALKRFEGRIWLSHQTSEEFFRNRRKVIVASIKSYDDAQQNLSDIRAGAEEPLNRLRSNRTIPDSVSESVKSALDAALHAAQVSVSEAKEKHPNYLDSDPLLDELTGLFDGAIGEPFDDKTLEDAFKEGKRRLDAKVPPGYLDAKKDGTRPYGDYFMWRQILEYAKTESKPVIFVTSEGKEDWWEKESGRTTGLHYELLKEAYETSGQQLMAYRTDRFFRFSSEVSGEGANESAAEEISAVVKARTVGSQLLRVVSQLETEASQGMNKGKIVIELLRPAYVFTCSGHLEPKLSSIPVVTVRLTQHPDGLPRHIVRSGAGTTFDFNVHLKSIEYQAYLPEGEYVFEYDAYVPSDPSRSESGESGV